MFGVGGMFAEQKPCFTCGQPGHLAKDCSQKDRCHNCQEEGHKASACPHPQRCRRCAQPGHRESACTVKIGMGPCHNCGKVGHFVKNCPEEELCHRCQKPGHKGKDCTATPACRRCHKEGHLSSACPERRGMVCPFYAQGSCKKGQECDYEHIGAPGYAASAMGAPQMATGPLAIFLATGEERRMDSDGKRYTKQEFKQQYGGYAEWDAAEERMSGVNGKWYTKAKFKEHFGGYTEWDNALTLQMAAMKAGQGGMMGGKGGTMGGKGMMMAGKGARAAGGMVMGRGAGSGEEMRISPMNGKPYTKAQFKKHFGGYDEWDKAQPASGRFTPYSSRPSGRGRGGM